MTSPNRQQPAARNHPIGCGVRLQAITLQTHMLAHIQAHKHAPSSHTQTLQYKHGWPHINRNTNMHLT